MTIPDSTAAAGTVACAPATLEILGPDCVRVTVHEGMHHQVKRMIAEVGATVVQLHRNAFGDMWDADLEEGAMRALTEDEYRKIVSMLPKSRVGEKPGGSAPHGEERDVFAKRRRR